MTSARRYSEVELGLEYFYSRTYGAPRELPMTASDASVARATQPGQRTRARAGGAMRPATARRGASAAKR